MFFPDGIERIGSNWFYGCDVESVEIPVSVAKIGAHAFCRCRMLNKVAFRKTRVVNVGTGKGSR